MKTHQRMQLVLFCGTGDDSSTVVVKKKKKNLYDGRTKEAKAFMKRMEMLRAKKKNLNFKRKYKRIQKTLDKSIFLQRTM